MPAARRTHAARITSVALAGATLAVGATALVGWVIGSEVLVRVRPDFAAMPPLTAAALLALGASLLLIGPSHRGQWRALAWTAATGIAVAIGTVAVVARTLGIPVWAGSTLRWDGPSRAVGTVDAPPSLGAGVAIVLISAALLAARGGGRRQRLSMFLLVVAGAIASVALNAHALVPAEERHLTGWFGEMSLLGSVGLLLATLGALTTGGARGLMALVWSDTPGGWLARRVLPGLLLLPGLVSGLVHNGVALGLYTSALERSLIVVAVTIAIALVFWNASTQIDDVEAGRRAAERLATTDPLTGLANRRGLDRRLAAARAGSERGAAYAIVAIDADGLKRVNDTLGHEAGDQVIRTIGETLRSAIRPLDLAARVGGDEFLVLLEGVGEAEAGPAARRIDAALNRRLSALGGGATVSTGVVAWSPGLDVAAVVAAADRKLYETKRLKKAASSPVGSLET